MLTNATLIYAPSQIALAAIIDAAGKNGENLDKYVTGTLFGDEGSKDKLENIVNAVRSKLWVLILHSTSINCLYFADIRLAVKNLRAPDSSNIKYLNEKVELCRNQDNNPDSQSYKRKLLEELEDEEDRRAKMPRTEMIMDGIERV